MQENTKSLIKILAIGNSFSTDSMEYLYDIFKAGGVKEVLLGNLYYGGCSLDRHYAFYQENAAAYRYYKNTDGEWTVTEDFTLRDALADEAWDYISFQQTSRTCGIAESYSKLEPLVSCVRQKCPQAKLIFNMTWAYQQDSTHHAFINYGNDQMTMYNMTVDVARNLILPFGFDIFIPCVTSIQNARTSFIGDTLTRDGFHLDYYIGRYIAGLTWYAAITELSVESVSFNPSTENISDDMIKAAKEAVTNAIKAPLCITESSIKSGERIQKSNITDSGNDDLI